jgi:uncharacterized protein YndB with AHSA1/START domain
MSSAILIAIAAIAAILIYAATRPDQFKVQRTVAIHAPAEKIFPLIEAFDAWPSWSPYEKRDPAMKRTRSGPASGPGAVYEWEGNNKVGKGRMEIVETRPPSHITIKLDFDRPFEAHNTAEFTLEPQPDATIVTWTMHGPSPYMAKLMGLVFDMDRMVGKDFEEGLANLKSLAEA